MAKTKYFIHLSSEEQDILTRIMCEAKKSERTIMRAKILLMSETAQSEKTSIKNWRSFLARQIQQYRQLETKPNYMIVPAAIRELEKIELVKGLDGRYRMDHAVTATQKTILGAFRMDARSVKNRANELSELLAGIGE